MQPHRSSATLLTLIFALLIIYATLYPFEGWRDQGINPFYFLNAPWPRYWSRFDVVANFVGYAPLGFLATLALLRTRLLPQPALLAVVACSGLSASLEALQTYLPERVPQLSDWLLNSGGAFTGAVLALALERMGAIDHWSRFRERWFVRDARAPLVLLALWPAALLFPPAVPLALGQVRRRLHEFLNELVEGTPFAELIDEPGAYLLPLSNLGELTCVALGFVIPCLLAYTVTLGWHRRALLWVGGALTAMAASSLSAALSYSPEHAWGWLSLASQVGLALGIAAALLCLALPRKLCLALLLAALVWQLSLINSAPETPYYAQTLQSWEQGRFIRFHGLAQWLGWLWPYAALLAALMALSRRENSLSR
ncbi:VanZ family protein [Variovorax sp. PCZ-1]|uniref:VanZ family protein n=1 Tax=Variovorax sp. PCZ-1 TaxID=2835533 RepID=UPI001BCE5962|nr:VanZ family protein [Variovorax sp. PCZ-1]MBS7809049.1 VanZ family protein [Variovorax sp. PCZ-1]